jgi:hypothetical protein
VLLHIRQAEGAAALAVSSAQGIVGAGPPQVAIGRLSGGTPAKPGFLRSKKCAQNQKSAFKSMPLNLYQDYVKFGIAGAVTRKLDCPEKSYYFYKRRCYMNINRVLPHYPTFHSLKNTLSGALLITALVTVLAACGSDDGEDEYLNTNNANTPKPIISVKFDTTRLVIAKGASKTLTAAVSPAEQTLKWASNNEAAATVDQNGEVTGVAAGSAAVTVTTTSGVKAASCAVTVADYVFPTANETDWDNALSKITALGGGSGGSPKVFVLDITEDFSVKGRDTPNITGEYKEVWLSGGKTISLSSNGSLIQTAEYKNQTFIIDGPILQGREGNTVALVYISCGSAVELRSGGIKDNSDVGVRVDPYGKFTMNGGVISGNHSGYFGGVVVHYDGTFIMNDGTIIGNQAKNIGGGVWVNGTGKFTMNGGIISGNQAGDDGGGVYTQGKFIMNNGTISDNSAKNKGNIYGDGGVDSYVNGVLYYKKNGVSIGWGNGSFEQKRGDCQPD